MKVQTGRLLVVAVPVPRGDYRLSVGDGDVDRGWCAVVGPDDVRHRREHRLLDPRRVQQRVMVGELVQDEVEEKFRVRGPAHVLKQVVPEEREKPAPDLLEVCDVSVVHEHVPSVVERVAVVLVDARAGTRRADVPEQERGADVLGERAEVAVVRRRGDGGVHRRAAVRVQTVTIYQPAAIAGVPTHPAPVHVDRMVTPVVPLAARGVPGPFGHVRQSVGRAVEELAEANLLAVVKDPATHLATPLAARGPCSRVARPAPRPGVGAVTNVIGVQQQRSLSFDGSGRILCNPSQVKREPGEECLTGQCSTVTIVIETRKIRFVPRTIYNRDAVNEFSNWCFRETRKYRPE